MSDREKIDVSVEADDAFCQQLYERYKNDPEKDEAYPLEECKREWGLA